jgi:hypothetical protein
MIAKRLEESFYQPCFIVLPASINQGQLVCPFFVNKLAMPNGNNYVAF